MAANSLRPIRRARISSFPATVSKNQRPSPFCFSGMGKGKLSTPSTRICDLSSILRQRFMVPYAATKASAVSLSWVASPEATSCFDSGPKIATTVSGFPDCAAAMSALPASSGEANVLASAVDAAGVSGLLHEERQMMSARINSIDPLKKFVLRSRCNCDMRVLRRSFLLPIIGGNYLRPPQPPPPPRLDQPRELSALESQPPPPDPLKADDPLSWSCCP